LKNLKFIDLTKHDPNYKHPNGITDDFTIASVSTAVGANYNVEVFEMLKVIVINPKSN